MIGQDVSLRGMKLPVNLRSNPACLPAIFLACTAAGCANPGPPRPPSLHLPKIVTDLTAKRDGNEVRLSWTTPARTTDELKIDGAVTAELCRSTAAAATCTPFSRKVVQLGPSEATDPLPPTLRTDPQRLIQYQVRLLNGQQHSAGYSAPAFAAAGAAPPTVTAFKVQATAQGALLQWEPKDAADSIELDRLHSPDAAVTLAPEKGPRTAKEPAELHLRADRNNSAEMPFRTDAGGTVDATARRGETYVYTAQRVRKVVLGGNALEIRSAPSPPVSITIRDTFPPQPPTGLETIAAGLSSASPAIDLSWRPNIEPDLAGYLVYRQELSAAGAPLGPPVKLTPAPIQEPGFHDATVVAGHIYSYTVTSIDETGNESIPGKPAREEIRLP